LMPFDEAPTLFEMGKKGSDTGGGGIFFSFTLPDD